MSCINLGYILQTFTRNVISIRSEGNTELHKNEEVAKKCVLGSISLQNVAFLLYFPVLKPQFSLS